METKGTGRARQGTIHAPTMARWWYRIRTNSRSYSYKMPEMRRLALRSALSFKVQENGFELLILSVLTLQNKNSKMFYLLLNNLKVLVVTEDEDVNVELSAHTASLWVQVSTAQKD